MQRVAAASAWTLDRALSCAVKQPIVFCCRLIISSHSPCRCQRSATYLASWANGRDMRCKEPLLLDSRVRLMHRVSKNVFQDVKTESKIGTTLLFGLETSPQGNYKFRSPLI